MEDEQPERERKANEDYNVNTAYATAHDHGGMMLLTVCFIYILWPRYRIYEIYIAEKNAKRRDRVR